MIIIDNIRNVLNKLNPRDPVSILRTMTEKATRRAVPGRKIALFGDSITYLHVVDTANSTTYSDRGYFHHANMMLGGAFDLAGVYGYSGYSSTQVMPYVQTVIDSDPDWVSIKLGVNDVGQITDGNGADGTVTKYRSNITSMVNDFTGNGIKVVLCTPTPSNGWYTNSQSADAAVKARGLAQIDAYHRILKFLYEFASSRPDIILADVGQTILDPAATRPVTATTAAGDATVDGTHPSAYGAYYMGREWARAVRSHIVSRPAVVGRSKDSTVNLSGNGGLSGTGGTAAKGGTVTNLPTGPIPDTLTFGVYGLATSQGVATQETRDDAPGVKALRTTITNGDGTTKGLVFKDTAGLTPGKKYRVVVRVKVANTSKLKYLGFTTEVRSSSAIIWNYGLGHESSNPDLNVAPINPVGGAENDLVYVSQVITLNPGADRIRYGVDYTIAQGQTTADVTVKEISLMEVN